jgi:hypothetical protein
VGNEKKARACIFFYFKKMEQIQTLGLSELALILKKTRRSVGNDVTRAPWRLPPQARRCGKQPLWLFDEVQKWLMQPAEPPPQPLKNELKRPGRPKKTRTLNPNREC